jgi:hypothetical protein
MRDDPGPALAHPFPTGWGTVIMRETIETITDRLILVYASAEKTRGTDPVTITEHVIRAAAEQGTRGLSLTGVVLRIDKLTAAGKLEKIPNPDGGELYRRTTASTKEIETMAKNGKKSAAAHSHVARLDDPRLPKVGATIVKVYQGKEHHVKRTAAGLEWNGKTFESLSKVACAISGRTGANGFQWFGPALGLDNRGKPATKKAAKADAVKAPAKKVAPAKAKSGHKAARKTAKKAS